MAGARVFLRAALPIVGLCWTLVGCSDGDQGPPGPPGPPGPNDVVDVVANPPESMSAQITSVTISSPPVVNFTVTDGGGRGAVGLKAGSSGNVRFTLAKLVPGENGDSSQWRSYVNRTATEGATTVTQATADRTGKLEDHGDGTYTYTFANDVTTAKDPVTGEDIEYDAALTHRLAMQISGGLLPRVNATHDFVPSGGAATTRDIAATASCNECHGLLLAHGSRYEVKYCVTCHNPWTLDAESNTTADMAVMTHKIHASAVLSTPYEFVGVDFSEVTYPQDVRNCRKCHDGEDAATPDGDNWKARPTAEVCGSCHDAVSFVDPPPAGKTLHTGGPRADNSGCAGCHSADDIETYHLTENATPNNPGLPEGLAEIAYEIQSVTADAEGKPVVSFRILRDGAPLDLLALPEDLTAAGSYPSFLVNYALPQDGIEEPADYNNRGRSAAQPASVSLSTLIDGTGGTLVAAGGGVFTATLNQAFPEGATLRAVALQGYFEQTLDEDGTPVEVGRHTYSVIQEVNGDAKRRDVVSTEKCLACHEIIEGHGGNRVSNVAVCVTCHNPNLTSSGRAIETPNATIVAQLGPDPLTYPEDSNNFKDMIHGIHASDVRTTDYEFVRNRQNGLYYNWSEVTFPGEAGNCLTCHEEGTYNVPVAAGALATTTRTTSGDPDEDRAAVVAARDGVPNDTDLVTTPTASACAMCHDDSSAAAHMELNGGLVRKPRADVAEASPVETCSVCHGEGRSADVSLVHPFE